MKQLTQGFFRDAPDWVKCFAIDNNGELHGYSVLRKWLKTDDTYHHAPLGSYSEFFDDGYDNTDWQNSAIDREASK